MTVVKILQYPDPRLKRKAYIVEDFGPDFQKVVDDMFDTHYAAKNCAALAATQLDIDPPPRVTVIDYSSEHDQPFCLVNAEIIAREGEQNEEEGCMSVGCDIDIMIHAHVKRSFKITVRGQDRFGKLLEFTTEGYHAKCIQHELDHLDGKVFLDHPSVSDLKRSRLERKLQKELRRRQGEGG
jgi:peptide deformylase